MLIPPRTSVYTGIGCYIVSIWCPRTFIAYQLYFYSVSPLPNPLNIKRLSQFAAKYLSLEQPIAPTSSCST